jgi:hypothetical protein
MTIRRTHRAAGLLVGGLALSMSLAACSEPETQEEAESAACDSLATVQAAADDVRALDASSTVEEAEGATEALAEALVQLRADAADVQAADADAIDAAVYEIRAAVADVEPEQTLEDRASAVADSTTAMDDSLAEITDGLGCGAA